MVNSESVGGDEEKGKGTEKVNEIQFHSVKNVPSKVESTVKGLRLRTRFYGVRFSGRIL